MTNAGPPGTMSYVFVFRDLSVLARTESTNSNYNRGFHHVISDIPANETELPAGMRNGYASPDVPGALQWSNFNDYGYFGPWLITASPRYGSYTAPRSSSAHP